MSFPVIPQSTTPLLPFGFSVPDKQGLVKQYVGKSLEQVRTPRLVVDRAIVQKNGEKLGAIAQQQKVKIRVHVKTHKTIEATAIELQATNTKSIVVSTLAEAYYLIQSPLVSSNQLNDVLLGLPISPDKFDDMFALADQIDTFSIFIDHDQTLDALDTYYNERFGQDSDRRVNVFFKVECGNGRAGAAIHNEASLKLARRLVNSPYINLMGLYTHAGQSYACRDEASAIAFLQAERDAAIQYRDYLKENGIIINQCSIGATPTVMAAGLADSSVLEGITELHAGAFAFMDRQQVATSLATNDDVAITVLSRVASRYPERGSILLDAGALAFSKDPSPQGGFGEIVGREHWKLNKIAQEHGVVTEVPAADFKDAPVGTLFHVRPNHCCLTAACFEFYLVVENGGDKIVDVWVPVRGW
ncbi:putative serine dehydratase domain-containing protein [Halteromyces radiatus]|uniref:putative serine dehydratase domain-containing protein n=1 Tax=Halteromyces radiatus TaxID=101107 RepID=UPI002220BB99|nr:putative serine dehydratase domain-containing protein [Halteromyces radiatus]KAI8082995.1 putative serine dehydratase domain-containing protein [Halteromyces radiatus]